MTGKCRYFINDIKVSSIKTISRFDSEINDYLYMQSSNDILENIKIVITKSIEQTNNLKIVGIGCDATCSLGKSAFQARHFFSLFSSL